MPYTFSFCDLVLLKSLQILGPTKELKGHYLLLQHINNLEKHQDLWISDALMVE